MRSSAKPKSRHLGDLQQETLCFFLKWGVGRNRRWMGWAFQSFFRVAKSFVLTLSFSPQNACMCIRTYCISSQTAFWRQVVTVLWTTEVSFSLQFISCFNYCCFSDDKNRLLCWCYFCLFRLKQDARLDPVLIHTIQKKGRVRQSLLAKLWGNGGENEEVRNRQSLPKPSSVFRDFPRVCQLQWVEHYTADVSVPQSVKYVLIEERCMPWQNN